MTPEELKQVYFSFYDRLPEPYCSQAKENHDPEYAESDIIPKSILYALREGFHWWDSPQRYHYWDEVANSIENGKIPEPQSQVVNATEALVEDRGSDYGHPKEDFERTAQMWSALLGVEVKAWQVPLCMIALKMSRETHKRKQDNLDDVKGYVKTLERCYEAGVRE